MFHLTGVSPILHLSWPVLYILGELRGELGTLGLLGELMGEFGAAHLKEGTLLPVRSGAWYFLSVLGVRAIW